MAHLLLKGTVLSDRRLPLPGRVVVLGRSLDADVPIPHRSVSRRHALIEQLDHGFAISDLGSNNGTFVREKRLLEGERAELGLGTVFRVGKVAITLAPDEVIGPSAPAPGLALEPPAQPSEPRPAEPPRHRPVPPRGAALVRVRHDNARWLAVVLTLLLLAAAGFFGVLLLRGGQLSGKPAVKPATAPRAPKKESGVEPVRLPQAPGGEAGSTK